MAVQYAQHLSTKATPPTEAIPGKPMAANNGGGFSFQVDKWKQLERFCILGSAAGTYYVSEKKLTVENAKIVLDCAAEDAKRAVDVIVDISVGGRAPKNDQAVFAIALIASQGSPEAKALALGAMRKVCRIGTHLFQFVTAINELRGWGRSVKRAIGDWYRNKMADAVGYQVVKYQQRDGMSHRDVFRLAHIPANTPIVRWIVSEGNMEAREVKRYRTKAGTKELIRTDTYPAVNVEDLPKIIQAFEAAKKATDKDQIVKLISDGGLTREMVPTQYLNEVSVWDALLENMPMTAMIRNLGKMTSVGLIGPLSKAAQLVTVNLANVERLKKSRVHPLAVLTALKIYAQGHGDKGSLKWSPVQSVVDALDSAFYLAFGNVPVTQKRWAFGLDVSGSMSSQIAGSPLSCAEASTALSLVTTHVEPFTFTGMFATSFEEAKFSNRTRLDDALKITRGKNFGGTDTSLLIEHCLTRKIPVDVFCTITDNETNSGRRHATQALAEYRNKMGIRSKNIVLAMTATSFTINDPSDPDGLDVCGFDLTTPAALAQFVGVPNDSPIFDTGDDGD